MDKNQKALAKERSFVMKLSKKDVIDLLTKLGGYSLNENIYSENDGKKLPSIERFFNVDSGEYQIMLRCYKNNKTAESLYSRMTAFMPQMKKYFNPNETVLIISDFYITELSIEQSQNNNQLNYAKFMYEKFGEYYREKYNKNIKQQTKKQKENIKE